MLLNAHNLLAHTRMGLDIYLYVFENLFPRKEVFRYVKESRPLPNPFMTGGQLLITHNGSQFEHQDLRQPEFKGDALDFAGHYLKTATRHELYFLLNQNLKLGLRIPPEEFLEQLEKMEKELYLPRLSYFNPPIQNTTPSQLVTLPQLYRWIIGPAYGQITNKLRSLEDPKQARQYKANHFPYVTFGGSFERRGEKHLLQASGLMVIDLDDLPEIAPIREALIAETHYETELLFVSPTGNGLKWVTSYNPEEISHLDYFHLLCSHLEALYALKPDESGKDISRACFIPKDENAFLHRKYLFSS